MTNAELANVILGILNLLVLVSLVPYISYRQQKNLNELEYKQQSKLSELGYKVQFLSKQIDNSANLLVQARDAVDKHHTAYVFLMNYRQANLEMPDYALQATKLAELSMYKAKLRGLGFAIGDKELLSIINKGIDYEQDAIMKEMDMRGRTQKMHTRIAQLLDERLQELSNQNI